MNRRLALLRGLLVVAVAASIAPVSVEVPSAPRPRDELRLSDRDFWRIVETFSEPGGYFNSDNLVSNEDTFQHVVPELVATVAPGGVYIGVGPDQNFTYVAAVRPSIAFIPDVRRGNLLLHLMYKGLIELSADRAEFLSKLFARSRPVGLSASSTVDELFSAYRGVRADEALYHATLRQVLEQLTTRRGFALEDGDASGIEFIYSHFFRGGPDLTFVSNSASRRNWYPTYESVQRSTDARGRAWGYLSSEAAFQRLKSYQDRNLIVPVVGNFAGAKALSSIAAYARAEGQVVTTFYASNVEQYLFQDGLWEAFRQNLARMPVDATSTFVRSCFNACSTPGGPRAVLLLDSMSGMLAAVGGGRSHTYRDVLVRARGVR